MSGRWRVTIVAAALAAVVSACGRQSPTSPATSTKQLEVVSWWTSRSEAVALNGALTQIVKFTAGRERPFVHALPADQKPLTAHPADNNVSFYSSHTSFAFSLAVSTATVASMRHYRWARVIWGVGLVSAAAVGYLRIAADQHYFTDVLVGAAAGSACRISRVVG